MNFLLPEHFKFWQLYRPRAGGKTCCLLLGLKGNENLPRNQNKDQSSKNPTWWSRLNQNRKQGMTVDAKQQKWHDATVLNLVLKQNTQFHTKHKYALQKQYRPTFPLFIHKFHLLYYIKSLRGPSNNNITDLFLKAKLCITNLEAVAQKCSAKKLFRKVLQNLHGNTCASLYLKQTPI